MIHSALRIGQSARRAAARRRQSASHRHHHHHRPAQRAPEPVLGPYNIWEYGEESNYAPAPKWIKHFDSAEARNAYLAERRARREAEEQEWAEYWRRRDEEEARLQAEYEQQAEQQRAEAARQEAQRQANAEAAAAAQRNAENANNAATAQMGCFGRTCKRAYQWVTGSHTMSGNRKGRGGRRSTRRHRRTSRKH